MSFRFAFSILRIAAVTACVWPFLVSAANQPAAEREFYKIITLPIPDGIELEAGAIQSLPNGMVAVSTRFGDIYYVENAFDDPPTNVKFHRFASGLHEVLGLAYRDGWLYATQRGEVSRLKDLDGDLRADLFETVCDGWGMTGDYHEYAFGSKFDAGGNIWVVLCLTGSFTSEAPFRGWCVRATPDGDMIPTCSGLRSPGGIGTNHLGDFFYTDNQGVWNGTSGLKHLKPGYFMGNPTGNRWYDATDAMGPRPPEPESGGRMHVEMKKIPELIPTAVYFPYNKMGQSASGIAVDDNAGAFGPFANQLFVGDQTHSTVMRVVLEKVQGRYQGACVPFMAGFDSGTLSLEFAPDGSLFVGGTERGWGARGGKPFSMQRVVWTGRKPFELHEMHLRPDGFELSFTEPVDPLAAADVSAYRMETYTYIYQSSYGSPEVDKTEPALRKAVVSSDGLKVHLVVDGLQEGHVHELHLDGVRNRAGQSLLHPVAYYTLNYFAE